MGRGILEIIGAVVFIAPLISLIALSLIGFTPLRVRENLIKGVVATGQTLALLATLVIGVAFVKEYLVTGAVTALRVIHHQLFAFNHHSVYFNLQLDGLNIWFVLVATMLSNIVGVFSRHYLHRDPGFFRFFYLIVLFLVGVLIVFMGSSFQVIFMGWEFVGITSALLISFFTLRRETIDNALHAFWAYRISDIGLLVGSFLVAAAIPDHLFGETAGRPVSLLGDQALIISLLLLFSAMGKSAQFPYSSWLPRAMEGPTSSSAIFYGGLSIHAGVFLLLRMRTELEVPTIVLVAMAAIGAISCIYGVLLSQVQSDVKSALAYASLSQVGIMFVEISLGWYLVAVVHCVGHAFLRTYQILKCSSIIHQFVDFENAHPDDIKKGKVAHFPWTLSRKSRSRLFSLSFDFALRAASGPSDIVTSLERISRWLQQWEEGSIARITGASRGGDMERKR